MIVPSPRLILLTALVLLPAGALAAWEPDWSSPAWGAAVLIATVAGMDVVLSRRRLGGMHVISPDIVRMTVNRPGGVALGVHHRRQSKLPLRIGLILPPALTSTWKDRRLVFERERDSFQLLWPCKALQRGRWQLTSCHIEIPSRVGLWALRRRLAMNTEIRVYPDLTAGQKNLSGLVNRREWGYRSLRKLGKGREFEQLREYMPGDSYEDVDWKATARRRYPVTRVYQVEQSQEIYVVLDASRLSTRNAAYVRDRRRRIREPDSRSGTAQDTIFEYYVAAALAIALAAERASDRYGLLVFGAQPDCFIKAGRGKAHYNACREALYNRQPGPVAPDFDELFTFIGTHMRKRALLLFLTHLDDPLISESFIDAMRVCARRHLLRVNTFRPAGAYPLFSSEDIHRTDGIYEHLAGHMIWQALSETNRSLRRNGAGFALLDREDISSQLIEQYMDVKQRQIL
jgi:uncharacterized protein (DUF58 family)